MQDDKNNLRHVAIIPDGNRRWAKKRNLPTFEGHRKGFESIKKLAEYLRSIGVQSLTVWAFSTENWNRDKKEVDYLMGIYETWLQDSLKTALKEQIRIIHLGRKDRVRASLKKKIEEVEKKTKHFTKFYFGIAIDYGGRDEVLRAVRSAQDSNKKSLSQEDFEQHLDTRDFPQPNPDLVIRTSGEKRTSGFLIWQAAYAEYIFHPKFLPDFSDKDLKDCVEEYNTRLRRFGK